MTNLATLDGLKTIDGQGRYPAYGELYCPTCGDKRRMRVRRYYFSGSGNNEYPQTYSYTCVQCDSFFTAVIYPSPDDYSLVVLPSHRGGLTTPNTSPGVAYYLDQASKAQSVGANSASIAMFRGALEHLLFEQGYTTGMLGSKLNQLEAAINAGTAPKWAMELETDFLDVMKELGNGAIHPNDGDVAKQSQFDNDLIEAVKATFHMLLMLVYEIPQQKQQRLDMLRAKASILKK